MSKENKPAEDAVVAPQPVPIFPKWFFFIAMVMVAGAALMLATAGARQHARAMDAFNKAQVDVSFDYANRLPYEYAVATIKPESSRGYLEIVSASKTDPERALKVYREIMDGSGTPQGKVLACHMAMFLAQDGNLGADDFKRLVKALDPAQHADVRGMAQSSLSQLVAILDVNRKAELENLPAAPAGTKGKWEARTLQIKWGPNDHFKEQIEFLQVVWSDPDACNAWWTQYTKPLTWNPKLNKFELPAK
jgi:hypothetical protein